MYRRSYFSGAIIHYLDRLEHAIIASLLLVLDGYFVDVYNVFVIPEI